MGPEWLSRSELLLGEEGLQSLSSSHLLVVGLGGVGAYAAELAARAGVGEMTIIDGDTVGGTNLNIQLPATTITLNERKAEVMKQRILDINPDAVVHVHPCFFLPETSGSFHFEDYDYVVDAIDTVSGKIEIIMKANEADTPVISCMGTGNKLDPTRLEVSDIYKTQMCPLAKVMRRELKKRGVKKLKVVYSKEIPVKPEITANSFVQEECEQKKKRQVPASIAFVPSVAGLIIAGEVIKELIR